LATEPSDTQPSEPEHRPRVESGKKARSGKKAKPRSEVPVVQLAKEIANGAILGELLHPDDRLRLVDLYRTMGYSRYQMAQQLGITERTVYRDLDLLTSQGRIQMDVEAIPKQIGEGFRVYEFVTEQLTAMVHSKDTPQSLKLKALAALRETTDNRIAAAIETSRYIVPSKQAELVENADGPVNPRELLEEAARICNIGELGAARPQLGTSASSTDKTAP